MKFSISHEGVIYATNPDGTVTKYGRIGSDGQLTDAFGRSVTASNQKAPVRRRPVCCCLPEVSELTCSCARPRKKTRW